MHFVEKFTEGDKDLQLEAMRKYFDFVPLGEAEVIFCGSISMMSQAQTAKSNSSKPLVNYCWDYYKWAHEGKAFQGNWMAYAGFLKHSDLVFVPSASQKLRLKELLSVDSVVVKSGAPTFEHEVTDGNFILDPVRYYPEENRTWAEDAARLLGIPIIHSEHQYSLEQFRKLVASCTFMTSCFREASTGGLSLIEGLWLGKQSLVSDSPYMGAVDYVGEYGVYFKHDDFNDLVAKMKMMWENRVRIDVTQAREYIMESCSYESMARNIFKHICELLNK